MLFISSRRTFGIKLLSDLKKYGFELYSDIEEQYIQLIKLLFRLIHYKITNTDYEYLIIDEIESLVRYMTSSFYEK